MQHLTPVTSDDLRRVAGHFPSGVVVVTSADSQSRQLHGVTVSAFASLSLDPPLVLVCITHASQSHDFLTTRAHFAVNILARRQASVAERFAGRAPLVSGAFDGVPFSEGIDGVPLVRGCVGWFECRREETYPGGDHSIVVGSVLRATLGDDDDPLVVFTGGYTRLDWG
jgi:flavin reductase (DIM6/NTAB) family NADH-FMN oxidoreductase RutF